MIFNKENIVSALVAATFLASSLQANTISSRDALNDYFTLWNICRNNNNKICQKIRRIPIFEYTENELKLMTNNQPIEILSNAFLHNETCRSFSDSTNPMSQNGNRSLSAYEWKLNYKENRFPRIICEAVCRSDFCANAGSNTMDFSVRSVPMTKVLGQLDVNGRMKTVEFTVGCTCAFQPVKRS